MSYTPAENFVETRARRTDSDTSKQAARAAASGKAAEERQIIRACVAFASFDGMTAREVADWTGMEYFEVQRRISETGGIHKTDEVRDGCRVWAIGNAPCFFAESGDRDRKALEGAIE